MNTSPAFGRRRSHKNTDYIVLSTLNCSCFSVYLLVLSFLSIYPCRKLIYPLFFFLLLHACSHLLFFLIYPVIFDFLFILCILLLVCHFSLWSVFPLQEINFSSFFYFLILLCDFQIYVFPIFPTKFNTMFRCGTL